MGLPRLDHVGRKDVGHGHVDTSLVEVALDSLNVGVRAAPDLASEDGKLVSERVEDGKKGARKEAPQSRRLGGSASSLPFQVWA